MRQLGLILGSAAVTIGICLSAFMAGLGLGSVVLGRTADSRARPQRLYGWLEIGIGVYGFFSPFIFSAGQSVFHAIADMSGGGAATILWIRGMISFTLLLVPTFLMGGTYPAAVRYLAPGMHDRTQPIGLFYATNTLGAAAAAFLFPTVLLEAMGMRGVAYLAALCNVFAAVGAFCFLPTPPDASQESLPTPPGKASRRLPRATASPYYIGAALLLSGFAALGLETLYNRVLILTFGSSIYSFSYILGVFLTGIGIGGWIFTLTKDRLDARIIFLIAQFIVFVHLLISLPFLDRAALLQMNLYNFFSGGQFWAFHTSNILTAGILCGALAIGFGLGYPAALKALAQSRADIGSQLGLFGAVNCVGSTLGSLLITFIFLPWLGSYRCFQMILGLAGLSILLIAPACRSIRRGLIILFIGAALFLHLRYSPAWDVRYFHTQISVQPAHALDTWKLGGFRKKNLGEMQVESFKEGRDGTVSVVKFVNTGDMPEKKEVTVSLFVNGKVDASDNYSDMVTQSMLGHLPMQLNFSPPAGKSALVIGMGSGMTAGTLAGYPLGRLDIVEISPDVVEAARRFFSHVNHTVLEDSRAGIFVEDGRNFLATHEPRFQYDFIVNEPSNVWMTGAANLFTREYFTMVRERLKPDGVLCLWFQMYTMSWESLSILLATLHSEFPHLRVFNFSHAGFSGDLLILATQKPLVLTPAFLAHLDPQISGAAHLDAIKNVNDLLRGYVMGTAELDRMGGGRNLHTDDRPVLELRGPRDLFAQSSKSNLFHFIELAPELMFDWTVEPARAAEAMGVEARAALAARPPLESGVRVVTFYDETRTYLHRQSFEYARWDLPELGRVELFSPLLGMTPQPSHRLTLSGFSKKSADAAKEFSAKDGRTITMFERTDSDAFRSYFAWNCPELKKTFFVRNTTAGKSGRQAAELFNCRIGK